MPHCHISDGKFHESWLSVKVNTISEDKSHISVGNDQSRLLLPKIIQDIDDQEIQDNQNQVQISAAVDHRGLTGAPGG